MPKLRWELIQKDRGCKNTILESGTEGKLTNCGEAVNLMLGIAIATIAAAALEDILLVLLNPRRAR
ncbi:MAG: hypothetical protein A2806_03070 [Candidatus Terrybacteria bacterium RIFCSPHIGHO2_01_FULL_48_17]|uniref:Uncharacterized protein n=1 Tax=Candidatus Terrybacteria bacterium RIFCSPHIGHO2_01_FULL_48_17 TaxID=1802362 RepID=A0A1G2PKX9_9BACT|nr:MAG: hypothetical protein A2806_03070 [Candidatus Terrybacteria bacterium RIFCSPHIGHO2_01_FULL_48_17]OHA53046.1 MAG: hypothetical protein A3A30_02565 [Candidatus Terrybacteria bacterium RIFCSPLOWO2_01_FULL_48_14]